MKSSLAIVLFAIVGSAMCATIQQEVIISNSSQCVFNSEEHLLTCKNRTESIECTARLDLSSFSNDGNDEVIRLSERFNMFGIGAASGDVSTITVEQYLLFPRRLNETVYTNGSSANGVKWVIACSAEKFADNLAGIRVEDCKCFARLNKQFFEAAKLPHLAKIEGVKLEQPLIGEILIVDKHFVKRFFGFGGLGMLGMGLWGGWGLGMGLGMGLWG
jgi:hypothetical protein